MVGLWSATNVPLWWGMLEMHEWEQGYMGNLCTSPPPPLDFTVDLETTLKNKANFLRSSFSKSSVIIRDLRERFCEEEKITASRETLLKDDKQESDYVKSGQGYFWGRQGVVTETGCTEDSDS